MVNKTMNWESVLSLQSGGSPLCVISFRNTYEGDPPNESDDFDTVLFTIKHAGELQFMNKLIKSLVFMDFTVFLLIYQF